METLSRVCVLSLRNGNAWVLPRCSEISGVGKVLLKIQVPFLSEEKLKREKQRISPMLRLGCGQGSPSV